MFMWLERVRYPNGEEITFTLETVNFYHVLYRTIYLGEEKNKHTRNVFRGCFKSFTEPIPEKNLECQ